MFREEEAISELIKSCQQLLYHLKKTKATLISDAKPKC